MVDVAPVKTFKKPVSLVQIKSDVRLANMEIVRLSRLSVSKVQPEEWKVIIELAGEK